MLGSFRTYEPVDNYEITFLQIFFPILFSLFSTCKTIFSLDFCLIYFFVIMFFTGCFFWNFVWKFGFFCFYFLRYLSYNFRFLLWSNIDFLFEISVFFFENFHVVLKFWIELSKLLNTNITKDQKRGNIILHTFFSAHYFFVHDKVVFFYAEFFYMKTLTFLQ